MHKVNHQPAGSKKRRGAMKKRTVNPGFVAKVIIFSLALVFMSQVSWDAESLDAKSQDHVRSAGEMAKDGDASLHSDSYDKPQFAPDEILVKLKAEAEEGMSMTVDADGDVVTGRASLDKLHKKFGVKKMQRIIKNAGKKRKRKLSAGAEQKLKGLQRIYKIKIKKGNDVRETVSEYENDPNVEYAEPNYIYHADATIPNDFHFNDLWGLDNTGQTGGTPDADIDAPEAWDTTTGSRDIIVAVIDSGVDYTHEDMAANMWTNELELNGTAGVDDDGNGYVDDIYGIDACTDGGHVPDADPMDDFGHGTSCAGIIGAVGNNGVGVVGVN